MAVHVTIPTALRQYASGQNEVELEGETVGTLLGQLRERYPELGRHLFAENGQLRNFVNIYVGDDDIRYAQGLDTSVRDGDIVSIIPAIAGGRQALW